MVRPQLNKPLFGKPYIKCGQCPAIWGYLFELGGLLTEKHSTRLDAFESAFLGGTPAGPLRSVCKSSADERVTQGRITGSISFADYVQAEYVRALKYAGDVHSFFSKHEMDRLDPNSVIGVACRFAFDGLAIAVTYPGVIKTMFQQTYFSGTQEEWERAYAAGLDIGPYKHFKTYEEAKEEENAALMAYCKETFPQLYPILSAN